LSRHKKRTKPKKPTEILRTFLTGRNHNAPSHVHGHHDSGSQLSYGYDSLLRSGTSSLAPREENPGALNDHYDIPVFTFKRNEPRGLFISALFIAGVVMWHLGWEPLVLIGCALPSIGIRGSGWIMSWFDRPFVVRSRATRQRLANFFVTVAVPVFNEDAGLLDRCIWALVNQSRQPQRVWVVDDGSSTNYSRLRHHWEGYWPGGTEVRWTRQANQGKRRAHAVVFESDTQADIFVTVDSDTTLERRAIEEGLKPFQSRGVMSVGGMEMGFNAYTNFLTRLQCSLQLYAQAVIGAAWSYAGDMYTNRGPFALYRASLIKEFLPVYRDEHFFGRRVILGDDSLLALCASSRGRSVQQLTAFGLTMWPETFSHHVRQRVRWARGRSVRNFWRAKYRPFGSYIYWFTVCEIYDLLFAVCLLALLIGFWPSSADFTIRLAIALVVLSVPNSFRTLCFHRSDETLLDRIGLALIRPLASLWASVVLSRIVRLWGLVTLRRQGWTTRQHGAELVLGDAATPADAETREFETAKRS
jgi:hyaluronan synthase